MLANPEISELRVPLARSTFDALERLKEKLRQERHVRRVTTRALIHEALALLFEQYGASQGAAPSEVEVHDG
jgi:AmiR/NasT family two-component response regulator